MDSDLAGPPNTASIYAELLQTLALDDPSLSDIIEEITLGSLITDLSGDSTKGPFSADELVLYAMPARRHLDGAHRRALLAAIHKIFNSISECIHDEEDTAELTPEKLPGRIQALKDTLARKSDEVTLATQRVADLIAQITKTHGTFDHALQHALSTTLPKHVATRNASIDLLAASIESALVTLSLSRARAERALYTYVPGPTGPTGATQGPNGHSVKDAVERAYAALKREERDMQAESERLDRDLGEYEALMQIVDGGTGGGYRQVVDQWTRVTQDVDECRKDLRRLGWTGD